MNELVKINYSGGDRPTVSGRELHQALQIKTPYLKWFPRMSEYGFVEGIDFNLDKNVQVQIEGGRSVSRDFLDHQLTINMAKELCMIQRSDIGKQVRRYFLQVEAAWNSPDAIMARALQFANDRLALLTQQNAELTGTIAVQSQQIAEYGNNNPFIGSQ